jgi:hypothetical protein
MKKKSKKSKQKIPTLEHDPYLMRINKGEKLYKLFFFRPIAGRQNHFEYRIMTKEKTNGMLEMVSYNFKIVDGVPQKTSIMRSPEVPKDKMDEIVQGMVQTTNIAPEEFEELDLSQFETLEEQIEFLKKKDKVDTMYIS